MDEREGRNGVDGSVGDVSQAHIHTQPVGYYSMATVAETDTVAQPVGRGHRFPDRQSCARGTHHKMYASLCGWKHVSGLVSG